MANDELKKGITGMVAAAGLALASGSALPAAAQAPVEAATPKPWTSEGLDPEMHPIAHLESSWGKNMRHATHPKGLFHTAFGACGLKPVTAHEQYLRSPGLKKQWPGLDKPEDFTTHFLEDPKLYNATASSHWQWLRSRLGSPTKAAYGWRWGAGAAARTDEQIQKEDPYIQKFSDLSHRSLGKMSINDVTPGQKKKQFVWDYTHLLTPENKMAGYQVMVSFHPTSVHPIMGTLRDRYRGEILHNGKPIGKLDASIHTHCLGGPCIEPHITIEDGHHRRGLGSAMYEGVFKEAKMAGIKSIHGYEHSDGAHNLHSRLAQRHGLGYKPKEGDSGVEDYPHGEYKYLIKAEHDPGISISFGVDRGQREHAGTIRTLLAGDDATDWQTALRIPSANQEDMDFLMDRLATANADSPDPFGYENTVGGKPATSVLNILQATRFWNSDAMHRTMTFPVFRKPRHARFFADNGAADLSTADRILDDIDVWAPKSQSDDGVPVRPHLDDITSRRGGLSPGQMDKVLGLVHSEGLVDHETDYRDTFSHYPEIHPDLIQKWMGIAGEMQDRRLLRHLGKHAHHDAVFEQMMKLPQDQLGVALHAYAYTGRMPEKHLKHLLAHPETVAPVGEHIILQAVQEHLLHVPTMSVDTAGAILRHPNKMFAKGLSRKASLPPEVYRAIYDADPSQAVRFIDKTNCPEDIRLAVTRKMLDAGETLPPTLQGGATLDDEHPDGFPISKEMVDLAVSHPNRALVTAALGSDHLDNDHAATLINNGFGAQVVDTVAYRRENEIPSKVDGKKVNQLIAARPQDHEARSRLSEKVSDADIGQEFYDSVAAHEMVNPSPAGRHIVNNLLYSQTHAPADFVTKALATGSGHVALYHHNLPQAVFDEHLPVALEAEGDPYGKVAALSRFLGNARADNPGRIQEKHLEYVKGLLHSDPGRGDASTNLGFLYSSPAWSKDRLDQIWAQEGVWNNPGHRHAILKNPKRSEGILEDYMTRPDVGHYVTDSHAAETRRNYLQAGQMSKGLLKRLVRHWEKNGVAAVQSQPHNLLDKAKAALGVFEPDSLYRTPWVKNPDFRQLNDFHTNIEVYTGPTQGHVQVRPGNQKLRKIRDIIMEKAPEKGEIKPKDLPPGDWAAGRLPNGNISAKKINEHIDAQEPHDYNYSHGSWIGAQRHTQSPGRGGRDAAQKVFQVNLTNDMFDKLEAAGVDGTFRKMVQLSQTSSHPVRMDHTLGWVRYDGNPEEGFHIDEIQSDFGQSFVKQMAQQAGDAGHDVEDASARAESEYPEEHYKKIKSILFKDRHPNEMIAEVFHQYLRDNGHHNSPVHMLHSETKAPISGQRTDKPLPGHMQFTYDQLPGKKLGMEPKSYGAIPVQNNKEHQGKPTWGGKVRKFDRDVAEWAASRGIEELAKAVEEGDFKGIAKAVDPTGGSTVDHKPHLNSHPTSMTDEVNDYRANVLESPTRNKRLSSKSLEGITAKVVYKTNSPDGTERKYMVKPYHERVIRRVKDWMKHPIQGWAEMANQGLYHAAGIGDLHQKVHVSEHPMSVDKIPTMGLNNWKESRKEPALVVHLEKGFKPVIDHTFKAHDKDLHDSVKKIGIMDFLTNNLDRHGLNLMVNPETRKVLAVDHSRSFQYKVAHKPFYAFGANKIVKPQEGASDSMSNYIKGTAIEKVIPRPDYNKGMIHDGHHDYLANWQETIENWWPKVSQSLRREMDNQLEQIKNPVLKEHIHKNFHARADLLDEMANLGVDNYGLDSWHENEVEMHRYGAKGE